MEKEGYFSIPELAKMLGLSRIAVYQKVRKGQIPAIRVGRVYAIPKSSLAGILGKTLTNETKHRIDLAVERTVKEYGEVLKMLGNE